MMTRLRETALIVSGSRAHMEFVRESVFFQNRPTTKENMMTRLFNKDSVYL